MPETVIVNLPAQSEAENNPPTNIQSETLTMLSQLITSNHQTLLQLIQQLETMISEVKAQLADLQSEVNETLTEMEAEEAEEAGETQPEVTITEVIVPPVPNEENEEGREVAKPIQQSKLAKMLFM